MVRFDGGGGDDGDGLQAKVLNVNFVFVDDDGFWGLDEVWDNLANFSHTPNFLLPHLLRCHA
jgi:hypothetical protein